MSEEDIHDGSHLDCPVCFKIKCESIQIQGPGAGGRRQSEHSRDLDMNAYAKMRRQGVQPKNVFGSHEIQQKAGSLMEVEHGVIMSSGIRKEMEARMTDAKATLTQ